MKRYLVIALCLLVAYLAILSPFTSAMQQKPSAVKLGIIPHPKVLQVLFPDYQELIAASTLSKVILYYGTLADDIAGPGKVHLAADYPAMSRAVHAALQLDPYNMDGYYFGQSILVWDVGQYKLATKLLEYGMNYRTWDWQLPFFAAFNEAYFLKDRPAAAKFYMRAGELSGEPLFKSLAGRYLQEAGETRMAIDYLQTIIKNTRKPAVKKTLLIRIEAFKTVLAIEQARDRYTAKQGHPPENLDVLVGKGYLEKIPVDPYGGKFFLDQDKQVRSTSKFAFAGVRQSKTDNSSTSPKGK